MADAKHIFEVVFRALDEASTPLRGIVSALLGTSHEAEHAGHALHKAGQEAEHLGHHGHVFGALSEHVTLLGGHFGHLNANIGEVGHSLAELMPALAALSVGAGLGALFELTAHTAETASEMNASAIKAGMTLPAFQALKYAAEQADVPVSSMETGLARLNRTIAEAAGGKNKEAAALFHHIGVETRDAKGHLVSLTALLPELAEAFRKTSDPAMRARMAMTLFGRGGVEMLPLLMQGREELEESLNRFGSVGHAISPEEMEGLERFKKSWLDLKAGVEGLSTAIGAALAPVLEPIVRQFQTWVAANREFVALNVREAVEGLRDALAAVDWKGIIGGIEGTLAHLREGIDAIGGFKVAFEVAGGVIALRFLAPVIEAVTTLGGLTIAAGKAAFAVGTTLADAFAAAAKAAQMADATMGRTLLGRAGSLAVQMWEMHREGFSPETLPAGSPLRRGTEAEGGEGGDIFAPLRAWAGRMFGLNQPFAGPTLAPAGVAPRGTGPGGGGEVRVRIDLSGAPPGAQVDATASGAVAMPEVNLGPAFPGVVWGAP